LILVDTSVWIDHLRQSDSRLAALLNGGQVMIHPFVIGEIACGNLANRATILALLSSLPPAPIASYPEVLGFLDARRLMGRGLGYVDIHLLASIVLDGTSTLWTRDKRLEAVAIGEGVAYEGG
jgi:predicted nucleic acid-binding protein